MQWRFVIDVIRALVNHQPFDTNEAVARPEHTLLFSLVLVTHRCAVPCMYRAFDVCHYRSLARVHTRIIIMMCVPYATPYLMLLMIF